MVANGVLLVPASASVPELRAEALLQHEVGTHALTYTNGSAQPLRLLAAGLAGYEGTQEGLALLAEHLVGGFGAAGSARSRPTSSRCTGCSKARPSGRSSTRCRRGDRGRRRLTRPRCEPSARVVSPGRRVPARPLRSARLPGRRRGARHAVAREDATDLGPAGAVAGRARHTPRSTACYLATSRLRRPRIGSVLSHPARTPST